MMDRLPNPGTHEEESLVGGKQPTHTAWGRSKKESAEKMVAARDKGGGERKAGNAGGSGKPP